MADKKIIAVVGATGHQGGGLVRAIAGDAAGGFTARALTRDVNSEKARELARIGAEVVAADVSDPASLRRAFEGAHGAFCVTFYWAHFDPERETGEGRALARAAKEAGVKHAIWSTLEDTRRWMPPDDTRMPVLMGRYRVPHCDSKGEADAHWRELGVPTTFLLTSFYWENFIMFGMAPKRGKDGRLVLALPMGSKKLPGIASEDIGRCAYAIFKRGSEFIGRTVGIAGEHLTGAEMAAGFAKAYGREVGYEAVPPDVYRGLGFPGAVDLGNMFQFKHDFNDDFRRARSVEFTRSLNPRLQTFAGWLEENKGRMPLD
jgi:uncharacterized protein YbjT (DUF2867 family)